jgi:aspartate/glutamate racemase
MYIARWRWHRDRYAKKLTEKKWDDVSSHLLTGVDRLVRGGADLLVIASNTGEQFGIWHFISLSLALALDALR